MEDTQPSTKAYYFSESERCKSLVESKSTPDLWEPSAKEVLPKKATTTTTFISLTVIFGLLEATPGAAQTSGGTGGKEIGERVAAIKSSIQESQKRLRSYQWIETTVVRLKGEEKSRTQVQLLLRCGRQPSEGADRVDASAREAAE